MKLIRLIWVWMRFTARQHFVAVAAVARIQYTHDKYLLFVQFQFALSNVSSLIFPSCFDSKWSEKNHFGFGMKTNRVVGVAYELKKTF